MKRISWGAVLIALYVVAFVCACLSAGPRPCEAQAHDKRLLADPPRPRATVGPAVRLVSAKDVPLGNYARTGQDVTGVVIGTSPPPADAMDQTPTVQVLILAPGRAGNAKGEIATVGGLEIVIDLGPVPVPE